MNIYMVTDMEGCSGIVNPSQLHGHGPQVVEAGKILIKETNAAVRAAYEAGAEKIIVNNGHVAPDEMQWDLLDQRPEYTLNASIPAGLDESFSAVGLIGQHAMVESGGVLEHSFDMRNYYKVTLNGITVGEAGFIAAIAGELGIKTAFLAGDDTCCREIEELVPGIATAPVKQALNSSSAISLHPEAAAELIAETVTKGLSNLDSIKPFRIEGPIEVIIDYYNCAPAERNSLVPGVEKAGPRSVKYTADNAIKAMEMFGLLARIV